MLATKQLSATVVDSPTMLKAVIARMQSLGSRLYVDTETTNLNSRTGKLIAIQVNQKGLRKPIIVDCRRLDPEILNGLNQLTWVGHNLNFDIKWLWSVGIRPKRVYDTMIADQILRSDGNGRSLKELVLETCGVDISKDEREWFYDLDTRVDVVPGDAPDYLEVETRPWDEEFPERIVGYMATDVEYLPDIFEYQNAELTKRGLMKTMQLEMRALPAIAQMELNGVKVDAEAWRAVIADKEKEASELETELYQSELAQAILKSRKKRFDEAQFELEMWQTEQQRTLDEARRVHTLSSQGDFEYEELSFIDVSPEEGEGWGAYKKRVLASWKEAHARPPTPDKKLIQPPNFGSSAQLLEGLAELGIHLPNTESETLEKAAEREPVLTPLLEFRRAQKFSSTYGESLLERIGEDGRIHPEYQQIGAETGRMSCRRPNWQNIPARTADGARLRKCVVPSEGNVLLVTDFPNIELRILAEMSGDESMLEMFASGTDLHSFTARRMFGLSEDVDPKQHVLPNGLKARDVAKTINFGVVYGQSAAGFARKFKVDIKTAEGFIAKYFEIFPNVRSYLDSVADTALENGYSSTILGRKRYYHVPKATRGEDWEARRDREKLVAGIRRQSRNHPVQGTSADMTKLALALFHERVGGNADGDYDGQSAYYGDARLVAVVHDEVVVEVGEDDAESTARVLRDCMYTAATHFLKRVVVPEIGVHIGATWEH